MESKENGIPNKSLFKIEQVCEILDIKPYVLRFWESEFSDIRPIKSSNGQKLYEYKHMELLQKIKKLLMDEKMTVNKVKRELKKVTQAPEEVKKELKRELKSIKSTFPRKNLSQRKGQGKHISNESLGKLVAAKAKIQDLMIKVASVQEKNNW